MLKSTVFLLRFASILSAAYGIIILIVSGIKTSFLWIWPFLAVCCLAFSLLLDRAAALTGSPWHWLRPLLLFLLWTGFLFLFIVECWIIRSGEKEAAPSADYLIVLGAQVRGTTPSLTLQDRIDTAARYLLENPDTVAVCSGGQGQGEEISEAQAICQGLAAAGISTERLLLEPDSINTAENLSYSKLLIEDTSASIVIVTSNFHCCRAGLIARKAGFENISTLGASKFFYTTPNYYFREFFALIKDFLFGNLSL